MAKPDFLGVKYAKLAKPVLDSWHQTAREGLPQQKKAAEAKLKSLKAMEARLVANPLSAGDTVQRDRWPRCIRKDYGEIPNLTRFELAGRWRGFYTLVGEGGGVRAWILYLWDHETYDKMSGYRKK